ncbi:HD domain-containing protein [Streptomyces sp. NPDC059837]|uniref:HD domain-containing protein n=1 Tax=unclassified Streptomyces TaxID=2593676 RepID=UPI00365C7E18
MNDPLAVPTGDVADAALAILHETVDKQIGEHSLRSFYFARLIAQQEGLLTDAAYDESLLFAATVMHDLGLGTLAEGNARFEVEGADLAAKLLADHGVPDGDIGKVWEAIALHSSVGLADRMGLLTYLTHKGVFTDGGRFTELSAELQKPVRLAYPRSPDDRSLQVAIIKHARKSPAATPPFSIAAELLRQAGG